MTHYISFSGWIEFTYISSLYYHYFNICILYIYIPTQKIHRIGTPKGKIESDSNFGTDFSYSMWFYVLRMMSLHKFRDFIPCEPAYHSSFQPAPLCMVSKLLTVPTILSQRCLGWSEMAFWLKLCDWNLRGSSLKNDATGNRGRSDFLISLKTRPDFVGIEIVLILLGGSNDLWDNRFHHPKFWHYPF